MAPADAPADSPMSAESPAGEARTTSGGNSSPSTVHGANPVIVTLDGVPDRAQIEVDGAHHDGPRIELPRDGEVHLVEVSAPDRGSWRVSHTATDDGSYTVALDPVDATSTRPTRRRRPAAQRRRAEPDAPRATRRGASPAPEDSPGFVADPGF